MVTTEYLLERKAFLEKRIRALERELTRLPEENLVCLKNRNYHVWYKEKQVNGDLKRKYLSKKNVDEARILALKTYKYRLYNDLTNELYAIEGYLKRIKPAQHTKMTTKDSPYRKLLVDTDSWEYAPYDKSTDHPEHLIVPAPKGEFVRSKSEASIAYALYEHNIPYRYEFIHDLGGYPIASDFTILHPRTFEERIWEHFGLADKEQYVKNNVLFKLPLYLKNGYVPGRNLLMTFEDALHPLGYEEIEQIINMYLLN